MIPDGLRVLLLVIHNGVVDTASYNDCTYTQVFLALLLLRTVHFSVSLEKNIRCIPGYAFVNGVQVPRHASHVLYPATPAGDIIRVAVKPVSLDSVSYFVF